MSDFNFETPSKQALKGILFLVFPSVAKSFKTAYLPLVFYIFQVLKNPEQYRQYLTYIVIGVIALVIFSVVRGFLSFQNFNFYIAQGSFVLKQGILKKQRLEIALSKIQNVHIAQNFLQRLVGVVEVQIDTAGDKTTEVVIKSLAIEKAHALKEVLVTNTTLNKEAQPNATILHISFSELLLAGLTQNHFNSFYILSAVIFGLLIDFRDVMEMIGYAGFVTDMTEKAASGTYFTLVIYGIMLLVAIGSSVLFSLGKVVLQNYGLRVTHRTTDLEIEKGLLNRLSYSLKSSRIQSVAYRTNVLKQRFGMYSLRFYQAMSATNSKKNIEIEGINQHNLKTFEQFVFGGTIANPIENQIKPDPYFKRQLFIRMLYLVMLINVIAIPLLGFTFGFINLIFVPWLLYLNYLRYQKSYYSYQEAYLIVGAGRIDTVTNIVEHHKIQSLKLQQNYFEKKRAVARITLYTASNFMTIPAMPYAEAIELYDTLLYKVESKGLDWI
tara:strand:- start:66792 stop:68279 length:1488 start_codon:yes stop_codon:yes gene_type:complete